MKVKWFLRASLVEEDLHFHQLPVSLFTKFQMKTNGSGRSQEPANGNVKALNEDGMQVASLWSQSVLLSKTVAATDSSSCAQWEMKGMKASPGRIRGRAQTPAALACSRSQGRRRRRCSGSQREG